jgi:HPt (histidine-containing phosphotransfer) domain-containing protein
MLASSVFDLVIMDVQMPEIDGLTATREIRKSECTTGTHIPIIAMTAHAVNGDKERCLESGMDAYMSNPVTSRGIAETINELYPTQNQVEVESAGPIVSAPSCQWDRKHALERVEGDELLLRELVQIFLEESPKQLAKLKHAIETENLVEVERTAHSLKGELVYLGLPDAAQHAKDLERMGRDRTLKPAADLFSVFEAEVSGVTGAMHDMLDEKHEVLIGSPVNRISPRDSGRL